MDEGERERSGGEPLAPFEKRGQGGVEPLPLFRLEAEEVVAVGEQATDRAGEPFGAAIEDAECEQVACHGRRLDLQGGVPRDHVDLGVEIGLPADGRPEVVEQHQAACAVDGERLRDPPGKALGEAARDGALVHEERRAGGRLQVDVAVRRGCAEDRGDAPARDLLDRPGPRPPDPLERTVEPFDRARIPAAVRPGRAERVTRVCEDTLEQVAVARRHRLRDAVVRPEPDGARRRRYRPDGLQLERDLDEAALVVERPRDGADDDGLDPEKPGERLANLRHLVVRVAVDLHVRERCVAGHEHPPVRVPDEAENARAARFLAHVSSASRSSTVSRRRITRASPSRTRTAAGRGTPL